MALDIADRIEKGHKVSGEIKVNVIRESRVISPQDKEGGYHKSTSIFVEYR